MANLGTVMLRLNFPSSLISVEKLESIPLSVSNEIITSTSSDNGFLLFTPEYLTSPLMDISLIGLTFNGNKGSLIS